MPRKKQTLSKQEQLEIGKERLTNVLYSKILLEMQIENLIRDLLGNQYYGRCYVEDLIEQEIIISTFKDGEKRYFKLKDFISLTKGKDGINEHEFKSITTAKIQ